MNIFELIDKKKNEIKSASVRTELDNAISELREYRKKIIECSSIEELTKIEIHFNKEYIETAKNWLDENNEVIAEMCRTENGFIDKIREVRESLNIFNNN